MGASGNPSSRHSVPFLSIQKLSKLTTVMAAPAASAEDLAVRAPSNVRRTVPKIAISGIGTNQISENFMRSDKEIEQDVLDELQWDPDLDATDIAVTVKNGVVTLTGFTHSYLDKYEA